MTAPVTNEPFKAPDLTKIAPIEQQLEWLNALVDDRAKYVRLVRSLMHSAGANALVHYDRKGRTFYVGAWDDQFEQRRCIASALVQHAKENGLLIDLMAHVEADGFTAEMRRGDMRALALTMKRFIHTGAAIYLTREGVLEESQGMPAEWVRRGPNALAIENAMREWITIRRLPGMDQWAERFVRRAGYRRDGFIILEKRT